MKSMLMPLKTLIIAIGIVCCLAGCAGMSKGTPTIRERIVSFISDSPNWPPPKFFDLIRLRNGSIASCQVVTVEICHDGSWRVRDRQLIHDGCIVISDYTIWINADSQAGELERELIVRDASELLRLMHAMVYDFCRLADPADHAHGNAAKFHAINSGVFWGDTWLGPYQLERVLESSGDPVIPMTLPGSAILETAVRLIDYKLITHDRPIDSDPWRLR